jgi:hypothetical protein
VLEPRTGPTAAAEPISAARSEARGGEGRGAARAQRGRAPPARLCPPARSRGGRPPAEGRAAGMAPASSALPSEIRRPPLLGRCCGAASAPGEVRRWPALAAGSRPPPREGALAPAGAGGAHAARQPRAGGSPAPPARRPPAGPAGPPPRRAGQGQGGAPRPHAPPTCRRPGRGRGCLEGRRRAGGGGAVLAAAHGDHGQQLLGNGPAQRQLLQPAVGRQGRHDGGGSLRAGDVGTQHPELRVGPAGGGRGAAGWARLPDRPLPGRCPGRGAALPCRSPGHTVLCSAAPSQHSRRCPGPGRAAGAAHAPT